MLNKQEAKALVQKLISSTKYQALIVITSTDEGVTRFANSEISQNITITEGRATVTLYDGKKQATCTTNALLESGMEQLVRDAESMLAHVPEGEYGAFPFSKEDVVTRDYSGSLASAFDVTKRAQIIKSGVGHLEPGYTASGALALTSTAYAVGSSCGGFRYTCYDKLAFNTVVTHQDGTDGAAECTSFTDEPDIVSCFKTAQTTAKNARNPIEPELGAFTVVLSPVAFGDLISFSRMMLDAKAVHDGMSFAYGKVGTKAFGANFTMHDDSAHPSLLPLPFDMEGNPRKPLPLIEKGVISNILYNNKYADKNNVESTGHAISAEMSYPLHIVVDAGDQTLDEIIANTEKGIFINEFHYTNFVNMRKLQITGLTRNGTFLIENGKITKPLSTLRFTESLENAFNNITAISKKRELVDGALVPAVRIENFHFTSKA